MRKKWISLILSVVTVFSLLLPASGSVGAAAGPTVTTTLSDNLLQRGSKKTFDVWAKNAAGKKIKATVKLNGQKVEPTWDDNEKTSYTLVFTKIGQNIVTVSASADGGKRVTQTYHITYQKAKPGEAIGTAVWSVELFTIGCGYLIAPVKQPIYEGETAAEQLVRLLHHNGYVGYYGGTVKSSFYLAYIASGTATGEKYNSYKKSGTPTGAKKLNLSPKIPAVLVPHLKDTMTFYDPADYQKNWVGYLGEFAFTNGSGWMYSVNHIFPNVGFADSYLSDGDVVRVQYTLGYGADIGGFGAVGTEIPNVETQPTGGYFAVANKDELSKTICKALALGNKASPQVQKAYENALAVMAELNASQSKVGSAVKALNSALAAPGSAVTAGSGASRGGNAAAETTSGAAAKENNASSALVGSATAMPSAENGTSAINGTLVIGGNSANSAFNSSAEADRLSSGKAAVLPAVGVTALVLVILAGAAVLCFKLKSRKNKA